MLTRRTILAAAAASSLVAGARRARAATKLRVGKSNPHAVNFTPVDVGLKEGYFTGLDLEVLDFAGSGPTIQALVAGDIDISLGAGTDMAFVAKGVPMKAVAAIADAPTLLVIIVGANSSIKTADDMRGKKVQVSSAGSLTDWLVHRLSVTKGWGPDGITTVPMGGDLATQVAALTTHEVDAIIGTASVAYLLEARHQGRMLMPTSDYVHDFLSNAIYATDKIIASDPDAVRAYLKGWFEAVDFMVKHKSQTLDIVVPITAVGREPEAREYDLVMPSISRDGKFPPKALATIAQSFIDMKILPRKPDMSKLYTEQFLPSMS